ncbi:uncharacterized protein FIESC28_00636 [Fusarium coffeatum]|uniref:Xylanolytic transcriptional activator regulatory domain-containing protein n=1 Tax=Fusarium coffeatum TaxID=231269 RepID=A0A366SCV7_9HYPO|nr:uncharacterized protein FIESC28_00636 [Fusarium coffeatum]RBR26560.1 hypothetical protein FIESC28_00636 [Fusarium coffeatum]
MPKFLMRDQNHYFDSWIYKFSSDGPQPDETLVKDPIIYQVPYHAAEVTDPHLDAIKAKKWTKIIDDDKLLRKLIQIYLLKEYPFLPAFQKDYFLQDMLSGRKQYCSPLLVHAVLASACHGYSEAANRAEFWNPQMLGYQFLGEARRLWELEAAKPRLTTIQAAIVLSVVYDANGADEIGRQYLAQAVAAAHTMHLFSQPTQVDDEVEYNAKAITAWSLFGLQAVHSFAVFKAPLLSMPPSIALPEISEESNNYGDLWLRYPSSKRPIAVNYSHTFIALAEFRAIINDMAAMFFIKVERPVNMTINSIQGFCVRLDSWYRNLPPDLTAEEICFPWQLKLHMHYYNLIIFLLETLNVTTPQALYDASVQRALNEAKVRLETILRLYYLRHGYESYDLFLLSLLSFLGFMQIKAMNSIDSGELESRRSTVALAAKGLHDQSRNCYLAEIVFRIMKRNMGADSYYLLKNIDIGDEDEEASIRMSEQVHSSWPIDVHSIDENADKQRIENLIRKTDRLRV